MAGIQAESRKRALEGFARRIDLWTGGKNAPHFDIAQLFIKRCRELYLENSQCPAGWLVKLAAMKSGGWEKFRLWHRSILAQSLDLERIKPFGGGDARRCCVLFDRRPSSFLLDDGLFPPQLRKRPELQYDVEIGTVNRGWPRCLMAEGAHRRPMPYMSLNEARHLLNISHAPEEFPKVPSGYRERTGTPLFRQGATVVPKVLTVVDEGLVPHGHGHCQLTTVRSSKKPWSLLDPLSGIVPETWVRPLLTSNELYAFITADRRPLAIIPVDGHGRLHTSPTKVCDFWTELEEQYEEFRGRGRSTPQTLMAQLDFNGKLSRQLAGPRREGRRLVVYPTSGDIMRAARTVCDMTILGHTLHWYVASSAKEATYLVGILNAPALNPAFVQSRTSGRHFTNSPWRYVPVPSYSDSNPDHERIARIARQAERMAERWLASNGNIRLGQVGMSKHIRRVLDEADLMAELDDAVARILPKHVTG